MNYRPRSLAKAVWDDTDWPRLVISALALLAALSATIYALTGWTAWAPITPDDGARVVILVFLHVGAMVTWAARP